MHGCCRCLPEKFQVFNLLIFGGAGKTHEATCNMVQLQLNFMGINWQESLDECWQLRLALWPCWQVSLRWKLHHFGQFTTLLCKDFSSLTQLWENATFNIKIIQIYYIKLHLDISKTHCGLCILWRQRSASLFLCAQPRYAQMGAVNRPNTGYKSPLMRNCGTIYKYVKGHFDAPRLIML